MKAGESRGDFSVNHPLVTVLILTIAVVILEFVAGFVFFGGPSSVGNLLYKVLPGVWGVTSLCILVRSFLWRMRG